MSFDEELQSFGASELERGVMLDDPRRGAAALHEAKRRGVQKPLKYAMALVMNPRWRETGGSTRTNVEIPRIQCATCDGERLLLKEGYDPVKPYSEVYVRCPECNPGSGSSEV